MSWIFTGFEPNANKDTLWASLGLLFSLGGKWKEGPDLEIVEKKFKAIIEAPHVTFFDSGRTALWALLTVFGVTAGDEVLVQGYTCMVVANAITKTGATPVYVDIGVDLNMSPIDLEKKISPKAKVLIIQHTFGNPADMEALVGIARAHGLGVIEDSAHLIGTEYRGRKIGSWGDGTVWSFGSDKSASCVRGGAASTNKSEIAEKLKAIEASLPHQSRFKIKSHLQHISIFLFGKRFYGAFIGKALMAFTKKTHATSWVMESSERRGEGVKGYPAQLPNALAQLLSIDLDYLPKRNEHRRAIGKIYAEFFDSSVMQKINEGCTPLRFFVRTGKAREIQAALKKEKVILGDWWDAVVAPRGSSLEAAKYSIGSCPEAERVAGESLNLPIHEGISEDIARMIAEKVKQLL